MLASIIISTYNRAEALVPTLAALARQDLASDQYEVLVVDDGSTDDTPRVLSTQETPYALRTFRLPSNRGVSAGRNLGIRAAVGKYLIFLSDDLIVSDNFVSTHSGLHERFSDAWIVGGFKQLVELSTTPFGRYLDELERGFGRERAARELAPGLWQLHWPTARNLSLPRSDIARVGLFDERFRITCEDQDLAQRAKRAGIRFLYSAEIECLHNDHAAELRRYCRFQELGARDTVRLYQKHPRVHGRAPIIRENGPSRLADGARLASKKLVKRVLAGRRTTALLENCIHAAERVRVPDKFLFRGYRGLIGLYIFRGWRAELRQQRLTCPASPTRSRR